MHHTQPSQNRRMSPCQRALLFSSNHIFMLDYNHSYVANLITVCDRERAHHIRKSRVESSGGGGGNIYIHEIKFSDDDDDADDNGLLWKIQFDNYWSHLIFEAYMTCAAISGQAV